MSLMDEYNAFRKQVTEGVTETLLTDVAERLVEHIQASVQENVYNAYDEIRETNTYIRRGEEKWDETPGLQNPESYDRYTDATGMELTIENMTVGNPRYAPPFSQGYDAESIGDIIEEGTGYNWKRSTIHKAQPFPRPFMQPALDAAMQDGSVEKALSDGLRKRGL